MDLRSSKPTLKRRHVLGALLLSPALMNAVPALAGGRWQAGGFRQLAAFSAAQVREKRSAGFAVGISAPGLRKMAFYGLENISTKRAVSDATMFRLASVTKPITAACILSLCENGVLNLNMKASVFFPDFPYGEEITVYQLLTHTSGIANWWGRLPEDIPADFMDRPAPHKAIMRMTDPFLFHPGTMRSYSNSGYVLLGEIIEKVTGEPFEKVLVQSLLTRCGASGMQLERSGTASTNWATGYALMGATFTPTTDTPMPFAAGGLRSNLHDILAFSDALFHGKLLSENMLTQMVAHAKVADGRLVQEALYTAPGTDPESWPQDTTEFGYGLGVNTWVQSGERFYSHAGLIDGFSSYLVHAPRTKTTIVLLSNTQTGSPPMHQMARDVMINAV